MDKPTIPGTQEHLDTTFIKALDKKCKEFLDGFEVWSATPEDLSLESWIKEAWPGIVSRAGFEGQQGPPPDVESHIGTVLQEDMVQRCILFKALPRRDTRDHESGDDSSITISKVISRQAFFYASKDTIEELFPDSMPPIPGLWHTVSPKSKVAHNDCGTTIKKDIDHMTPEEDEEQNATPGANPMDAEDIPEPEEGTIRVKINMSQAFFLGSWAFAYEQFKNAHPLPRAIAEAIRDGTLSKDEIFETFKEKGLDRDIAQTMAILSMADTLDEPLADVLRGLGLKSLFLNKGKQIVIHNDGYAYLRKEGTVSGDINENQI